MSCMYLGCCPLLRLQAAHSHACAYLSGELKHVIGACEAQAIPYALVFCKCFVWAAYLVQTSGPLLTVLFHWTGVFLPVCYVLR
jgi:hypothetical protein